MDDLDLVEFTNALEYGITIRIHITWPAIIIISILAIRAILKRIYR